MAFDLKTVRNAFIAVLDAAGINATSLRLAPDTPSVMVVPDAPFDIEIAFEEDNFESRWALRCIVPANDVDDAADTLDTLIEDTIAALHADGGTLGSKVSTSTILELRTYEVIVMHDGASTFLTAELVIEVTT